VGLRAWIDRRVAPHFEKGGRLQRWHVFYEMFDTMLYSRPASHAVPRMCATASTSSA
jgi:Na+-transporting NADH:ubiquinone oxidoreductase subunit NqrB